MSSERVGEKMNSSGAVPSNHGAKAPLASGPIKIVRVFSFHAVLCWGGVNFQTSADRSKWAGFMPKISLGRAPVKRSNWTTAQRPAT